MVQVFSNQLARVRACISEVAAARAVFTLSLERGTCHRLGYVAGVWRWGKHSPRACARVITLEERLAAGCQNRLLLWATFFSFPLPFIAILSGWVTAEVGRQPWVVYGLLRTADAMTPFLTSRVAAT